MTNPDLTEQQRADLDVARTLVAAGVPLFLAHPDPDAKTGFRPPKHWERTEPDPGVVDLWVPGLALCAVMGCGLDLIDIDPRNGADLGALEGLMPTVYACAATPSGGWHLFIASLGVGSRDNLWPGIDVKGGLPDGSGRGFAFIAPTVRASAVTRAPVAYQWQRVPDPGGFGDYAWRTGQDASGSALAARIGEVRAAGTGMRSAGGPDWWQSFVACREPQSAPAAEKAISAKLAEVSTWTSDGGIGFRTVLLRAALTLGGYVGGGYLDEGVARKRLEEAIGEVWGCPDADDQLWVQQGLDDGAVQPFHVFTAEQAHQHEHEAIAGQGEAPPGDEAPPAEPPWSVYAVLGGEPFDPALDSSDQGLAKAVAYRMYPALRFASDAKLWIVRGRDVWREHADDLSEWAIAVLAELMPIGETPVPKELGDRTEAHWRAVRRAQFMSSAGASKVARKLRAIVSSDHPAALRSATLDANPEILWAGGAPWDLRASGDVPTLARWVDPGTPHLRTALCAPDPNCATPRWDAFVAAVLPDPEVRAWALRVLAIGLTGHADAALPVLYGTERSGKTSLIEMLVEVLGSYAHAASPRLLSAQDTSHPEIIWDLKGRRFSFIDEGPRRGHDATERLKQLTGGGSLTGRPMRANSVTFPPSHTLVMTTNDEPHLTDPALRARMRLIPCNATESDVRPARLALLGVALAEEAPGILAALMRETAGYLADRDSASNAVAPAAVRGLAQTLAEDQNPVREWVENRTIPTEPGTAARTLYNAFAQWHQDNPIYRKTVIPSVTSFGRTLTEMGFPAQHTRNGKVRPLSILGWTEGSMPTTPTPAAFLGRTSPEVETSDASVTGVGRVERLVSTTPVTDDNTRSDPVSSCSVTSLNSLDNNHQQHTNNTHYINTDKGEQVPSRVTPSQTTLADVALRASTSKITKTEARAQLKAEARSASILAAAGATVALPAVVDRDGTIMALSLEQAAAVVRGAVERSGALTVDVETTGYPVGHGDYALRSVQLGDATAAVVFDPIEQAALISSLLDEAPTLHAHSATADLVPLAHAGLIDADAAWLRMRDTVIPAKLADPASTGSDPGLKKLAAAVLGVRAVAPAADASRAALFKAGRWLEKTKADTPVERSGWAQVDTHSATMLRYAASDVLDTAALAEVLPQPAPKVYWRERLAQRMTARVAHEGVRLDAEHIARLSELHIAGRADAAVRVRTFGIDNPGSDQQVGQAATQLGATLPTTKTGRPSVAAGVLEPLRAAEGPLGVLVGAVLDYRHADTALGLFLDPYRQLCERGDGRARPTVYTLGTDTGRMSCVRPNLQQLPREGGMRACLTADPEMLMIGADFSSVEIRVAAALSQDRNLLQFLLDGRDLHWEIARMVYGPDANKAQRYRVKRGVFGRIYGGGVPALAAQLGVSHAEMQRVVDALDALAPQLTAWSQSIREAVQRGQTQFATYAGRVIHLPREFPHKGPNFCIQGTARELLVDALVRWRETRWGACVLLPVHDELDVFVPAADAEVATAELVRCMKTELFGVSIEAEPSAPAFAWADSA
jgi:P4 family phage/plasmid primase-like protien